MITYLYQSKYNELTYFTIETIVDIFLEKEIKISREEIENIVSINEEKTEKEKLNLAEGLLKLLYITEDESEEEKKKLGYKYIKNTWFNRYLEYLAIKELKKIRNNIDIQYRKQAVEEILKSNSEYTKIYDLNGEQIIIGFVGYNIPKTIIENLNRILKEEILYFSTIFCIAFTPTALRPLSISVISEELMPTLSAKAFLSVVIWFSTRYS